MVRGKKRGDVSKIHGSGRIRRAGGIENTIVCLSKRESTDEE